MSTVVTTAQDQLTATYVDALLKCKRDDASRIVFSALDEGTPIEDIYLGVFQPALYEIGRRWQENQIGVAQEHYCTAATQLIMSQLYPQVFAAARTKPRRHVLVAASISGELHEIGVRMVADFMQMDGWDTHYLGANMPASGISEHAFSQGADVVALSVTLEAHLDAAERLVKELHDRSPGLRVLVGGHAFNRLPDLWRQVGADGHAVDARGAVQTAHELVAAAG